MVTGSAGITPLHVLYEDNSYQHPLRQGGLDINNAHLGVLANSTTERFVDLWQGENIDSGFLSRWMFVVAETTKRLSDPPPPDLQRLAEFCKKLRKLVEEVRARAVNSKILIGFANQEARNLWDNYYVNEIHPDDPVYNRIDTIGERLMMILAIAQNSFEIDAETVRIVIEFLRYQVAVRRILCPRVANNPVAALQQKMLARLPEVGLSLKRRDLYRSIHAEREGTDVFNKALDGLVKEGVFGLEGDVVRRLRD